MTVFAVTGCASSGGSEKDDVLTGADVKSENINLDPMLIRVGPDGESQAVDVTEVFKKAYQSYSERRYEKAARHYEFILEYFEDSRYYMPSLYNLGLAYEKLERWDEAAGVYERIIAEEPEGADAKDAYFRLAQAYEHTGEHEKTVELMTDVLLQDGLSNFDRVEAHLRRSNALLALEQWEEAEDGFRNAVDVNAKASPDQRLAPDSHLLVQAQFGLGRTYHGQVSEIRLLLPPERMGKDLDKKGKLFMSAQHHYIEALRHHHPNWSMAAGYMIGKLYEDFYTDIFEAEIPDDLSDEEVALYFEELRKHIRPLMERAIDVYEKNLSLSRRIGESKEKNRWVRETEESLEHLKLFLNDPVTQRRAEMLVQRGGEFESLWDPHETAEDLVQHAIGKAETKAANPGEETQDEQAVAE
ncbi:MAG: tetratricopeptide repeat protein [Myxococcota bacterium]